MKRINTILAREDSLKIVQDDDTFNFSIDSVILSFFARPNKRSGKIIDLGSGTGSIPLFMSLFTKSEIYGVELQEKLACMSLESVAINNLEGQIKILNRDIKGISKIFKPSEFSLVVSNPPYFKKGEVKDINEIEEKSIARHELKIEMEDIINEAHILLKDQGSLSMVQRTDRFLETLELLNKYGLTIKRLRFVYPKKGKESHIFLFDARKNSKGTGLKILEPLYIYDDNGNYTEEIRSYFFYEDNKNEKN